jgi:uncharacterized protein GlcG (DUF336 family)
MNIVDARKIADRGIATAQAKLLPVSIAVVDEFAMLVQLDRLDNAALASPEIAEAKAVTAMKFKRRTSELSKLNSEELKSLQEAVAFKIMIQAGGVPIVRGGAIVGAVGVSGGSDEQNEELALFLAVE